MYPDDRVLVGVINRKRDFLYARDDHWYRIPQQQMPDGIHAEYIAFFLSGSVFKEQSGSIAYYAQRKGVELAYRKDLLPEESNHKRAQQVYYRVRLGELKPKAPPVLNSDRRSISFIYTTWDRFVHAHILRDLYSEADSFVDRIYHALKDARYRPRRYWENEHPEGQPPQIRVLCERGEVIASTQAFQGAIFMDSAYSDDEILAEIRAEIAKKGGPVTVNIPPEG